MKLGSALGPLLLLILTPCFGQNGAARSDKSWRAFAALDYLAPGNQSQHTEHEASATCSQLTGLGAACGASSSNYGAWGGRLGAFHRRDGIELGGTLGYLYGGPGNSSRKDISIVSGGGGPGGSSHSVWNNTLRPMLEARERFTPFADIPRLQFVMGQGAGFAVDWKTQDCSSFGSLGLKCGSPPTKGWGTWEVSPSVVYRDFEIGFRYAGFARGRDLPWNTWGAFLAYSL